MSLKNRVFDPVDEMLKLAYLDGRITTRGLLERSVLHSEIRQKCHDSRTIRLQERLCLVLQDRQIAGSAGGALTLGECILKSVGEKNAAPENEMQRLSESIGVSRETLQGLCDEIISPLEIIPEKMRKLLLYLNLSGRIAGLLIMNSYKCAVVQPSIQSTLARYKKNKSGPREEAMRRGVRELYLKSDIPLTEEQRDDVEQYLRTIADLFAP